MEKKFFRNLVIAGFLRSLTLSVTGLIDCAVVGRYLGTDGLSHDPLQFVHESEQRLYPDQPDTRRMNCIRRKYHGILDHPSPDRG